MNKYLDDANEELKRVDHLIHVSLKYTRTVDIIKSIIDRLINTYDFCILGLLDKMGGEAIENVPKSPGLRTQILRDYFKSDPEMIDFIDFYHLLRDLSRADFKRSKEYRRHVTMTALLQGGPVEIDIDIITEYYRKSKVFFKFVTKIIETEGKPMINDLLKSAEAEVEFEGI